MYFLRFSSSLLLLGLGFLMSLPAVARENSKDDEVVEEILLLQRQIEELVVRLPPERREQVRKQLADSLVFTEAVLAVPSPEVPSPEVPSPEVPSPEVPSPEVPSPEVASPEVVPSEAVSSAPPPPAPVSKPRRPRRNRVVCNTLDIFDTNKDGTVDALDRYWRHLYLWLDRNRNGLVEKREVVSTFGEKVKEIASDLDSFATFKRGRGEVRIGERIWLDLRGNGFDPERSRDDAVLLVDASALARGTGPVLVTDTGQEIEGVQPFGKGWRLRDSEGRVTRLNCP